MTAQDHVVAWIESSRPHYDRLLELERYRKTETVNLWSRKRHSQVALQLAAQLVADAYSDMLRGGDALSDDIYSPADLGRATLALLEWELEA